MLEEVEVEEVEVEEVEGEEVEVEEVEVEEVEEEACAPSAPRAWGATGPRGRPRRRARPRTWRRSIWASREAQNERRWHTPRAPAATGV